MILVHSCAASATVCRSVLSNDRVPGWRESCERRGQLDPIVYWFAYAPINRYCPDG